MAWFTPMLVLYINIFRYRWLVNMWTAYGGRKDLAAISLQRQTMKVTLQVCCFLSSLKPISDHDHKITEPCHDQIVNCPPAWFAGSYWRNGRRGFQRQLSVSPSRPHGVSLWAQRPWWDCFALEKQLNISGGSVGLSPHPVAWSNFLSLYGSHLGSCPPNLGCPKDEHGERV